jgi:3-oxoadipate enol-lactonase
LLGFDSRRRLGEIKCPTLVIAGSLDHGDTRQATMMHEGIAGSQLVVIDNADHALIWAHADEFVRIVEEFLRD